MDVAVTFLVHTDDDGVPSTLRLDEVSLEACGVAPPPVTVYLRIVVRRHPAP
jgi:hypothetical protein